MYRGVYERFGGRPAPRGGGQSAGGSAKKSERYDAGFVLSISDIPVNVMRRDRGVSCWEKVTVIGTGLARSIEPLLQCADVCLTSDAARGISVAVGSDAIEAPEGASIAEDLCPSLRRGIRR